MSEINDILMLHDRVIKQSEKCAFATVISTNGPSYRSAGSRSLIIEDGTFGGGLSAGCLEGDIACRLDGNSSPFIVEYDLSEEDDIRGFPFGCGGTVQVFVEPLPNASALNAVQWLCELHEAAVLLTVVKVSETSKSKKSKVAVGARFGISESGDLSFIDGISESYQPDFELICKAVQQNKQSILLLTEIEQQTLTVFAEFFEPAINLAIFGDGEDARILQSLAQEVGMNVSRISRHDVRASVSLLEEIPSLHRSYAVVMTHDLNLDTKVLNQLIPHLPPYLGVMGPRSRTEKMLASLGADPAAMLARAEFYAPVGLNMAAETPSEIALSIVAEIQTVSRKAQPKHLRDLSGAIHERWQENKSECASKPAPSDKRIASNA
ncbi:MAG: XdhC family protein [Cyanobacteria bacterium SZAS-4]|nr:XdhC family protein [Cyanobacteria bacterium SZAS-4]